MNTRREFRNNFPLNHLNSDLTIPGNICKLSAGNYCNNKIKVDDEGNFTVSNKAYSDDVIAFISGCISSNPTISNDIKYILHKFINKMDNRAIERHGYKDSREKEHTWNNLPEN